PLLWAVSNEQEQVAKLLLDGGAGIDKEDNGNDTALTLILKKEKKREKERAKYPTLERIKRLLTEKRTDGALADPLTWKGHPVDGKFEATIVQFSKTGTYSTHRTHVNDILES